MFSCLFVVTLLLLSIIGLTNASLQYDLQTGEDIATYNGKIFSTTCPAGKYRPQGSTNLARVTGQRGDGCIECPRGRYGSTAGLTLSTCTSTCPLGKYGGNTGLTSETQCTPCSRGKYSSISGIKSDSDCNICPTGKYGSSFGLSNSGQCKKCPHGYPGWQCKWPLYSYAPKTTH